MTRDISEGRKTAYYFGMLLQIVGGLMFASTFILFAAHFGDFSNFRQNSQTMMFLAFAGMGMLILGGVVRGIGARGLAGSGTVLDPGRARQELEPYSRMAGGMLHDALEEADVNLSGKPQKVVMIKCPACGRLNEEDSRFCQECGRALGPEPKA